MSIFLNKIFSRSNNLDYISQNLKNLTKQTAAKKIFKAINNYSDNSEVRYVGGCIRKIINNEIVDDIDLATNLNPNEICEALRNEQIDFYETGIKHGTITAIIDEQRYEITSLRKDIKTDGRHADVEFSRDWKEDASRRDFSINSIYSDMDGNLFDPYSGKKDLENGIINFVGDAEKRIKEDYLRILRYIRFYLNYSKQKHDIEIIRAIKRNIGGVSKISAERLLDELKKLVKSNNFLKLFSDENCLELINIIFPQLKNLDRLKKLNSYALENFNKIDFIFLIALVIIDGTDNTEYFFYKFNISKKDQKRIKTIDLFYRDKINIKSFNEKNLNKILYFNGKQAVIDIVNFKLFISNKVEKNLIKIIEIFKNKKIPNMPVGANLLMSKYNIPEGRSLGIKLKKLEEIWIENDFIITEKQIEKISKN
jgi:poly(A) polymerase